VKTSWFLPETPDVLAKLCEQADITCIGMAAFAAWAHGDAAQEQQVRAAEHDADTVRRELTTQVRSAFSTPIDQEDLYALSELLDAVLNGAKNVVREADVLALVPDPPIAQMADALADGVKAIRTSFDFLTGDGGHATTHADAAISAERSMEKHYRAAMRDLLVVDDLRVVVARRELYRRVLEVGERMATVAERIWYSVVKES